LVAAIEAIVFEFVVEGGFLDNATFGGIADGLYFPDGVEDDEDFDCFNSSYQSVRPAIGFCSKTTTKTAASNLKVSGIKKYFSYKSC
jgi:hypothetical protein